MKTATAIILLSLMFGCADRSTGCSMAGGLERIDVKKIDGCEYITFSTVQGGGGIVHKANCNNPEHRAKP